ncbi:hypothetical protein F4561_004877 [Lipingzhangella halophila]|uniref:DUF742 domain-containing protein n=1 Tax=Lipingzhangella halophila TaxID=1783352 RepID=A0A7W7RLK6_9ACTN|nr:DUF742 domain-containing protein [Lipingzhangella halophila]MBB4934057.1 hypothetical protein [Lipingzhangella halophila]
MAPDSSDGNSMWMDEDAGPLLRHFAITRGRTRPTRGYSPFPLIAVIRTLTPEPPVDPIGWGPEHHAILSRCRHPTTLADLGSELDLPVSVLRVLIADLLDHELISLQDPATQERPSRDTLLEVLHGLEAL